MKKVFCFSLIVMFLALASSPLLVKADDVVVVTPYVDNATLTSEQINNLRNTSLLLEYLRNGGTIDVSNTSSNYSASDLLNDFGNFVKDIVTTGLDIINPFQTEVQYHGLQPVRVAEPAIWNLLGLLPFHALNENEDNPQPNPNPDYTYYLDILNGSGYQPYRNLGNGISGVSPDWNKYGDSWDNISIFGSGINGLSTSGRNDNIYASPITTLNINSNNDNTYTCLISFGSASMFLGTSSNRGYFNQAGSYNDRWGQYFSKEVASNTNTWTATISGTLTQVFDSLIRCCRHVNIYVDGELWALVGNTTNYNIQISTGTVLPSNEDEPSDGKVRWEYDTYIYYDIDLIEQELSLLLDEIRNQNHPTIIKFDDLDDLIVDADGQPAIAVKVFTDDRNIDEIYLANYGPLIPAFIPLFTPVIDDVDIYNIASTAVSPIPEDLLEVFGYMFMGVLFIGFIHRLLE